ncbi:transglycosylase domain-containing protein [Jiella sp. M17.18]|uniref:transglycosylase domain-containing protein n=1 Tax=Jiella sp. M17.18 TaxID=3234247 RepID=UPI0034DE7A85
MSETSGRRFPVVSLALVFLLLLFTSGLALVYSWVNLVARQYGASVALTVERVHANKLIVHLPEHEAQPFDAPTEEMMYVDYADVPAVMRRAILTSEDSWFFWHFGFNPIAVGKAVLSQFGGDPRGGSTITQQLAKQLYVGDRHDLRRKVDELAIALWLEWHFSKKQLLEFYFNTPFMGHGTKGIEAAARYYFGYSFKKAGRWQKVAFTPDMAASLAVTIKNPTGGNPTKPVNMVEARRLLLAMGVTPQTLTAKAVADPDLPRRFAAHAFDDTSRLSDQFGPARDFAIRRLSSALGDADRTLDVVTTYSSEIQLYLESAIDSYYPRLERAGYDRLTAVVVDNRTGGIKAMVAPAGARIYPGSSVKPLEALCAIVSHGWTQTTAVLDTAVGVPPVRNDDRHYLGRISLQTALAKSRNPPFVRLLSEFGPDCANAVLKRMDTDFRFAGAPARSLALGAEPVDLMDLLDAYVTIASCGQVSNAPLIIEEARDRRTQTVVMRQRPKPLPDDPKLIAGFDTLQTMLAAVTGPDGTARGSRFIQEVAGKTGTSDDNRQITLITFTKAYTVLVSVGTSDVRHLKRRFSSHALVPMVENINANIHPEGYHEPLGCAVPTVVASRDGRP